jgi:nucleoside-diphosphate-sugar epimerase
MSRGLLRLRPMKALVIAANSFLGKVLCQQLLDCGVNVVRTVRTNKSADSRTFQLDITDMASLRSALSETRPDWIVQCAAATATQDPTTQCGVHVNGTLNLLQGVAELVPHAQTILLGSAAEYGNVSDSMLPIDESQECRPTSFFGASKLAQYHLASAAAAQWHLSLAHLRPFNICGPGIPPYYFLGSLAARIRQKLSNGQQAVTIQNSQATRDFVDVRDVARAIVGLLASNVMEPGCCKMLNIACGRETSILDAARLLCQQSGIDCCAEPASLKSRTGVMRSCGSSERLFTATQWKPIISLEQSIQDQWQFGSLDEVGSRAIPSVA